MSYVYMKVLESAPHRYDRGMRLLTLGRLDRLHGDAAACIEPGDRVLDLGCGTGALALRLARRGAGVVGVDPSPAMLDEAAGRLRAEGLQEQVELRSLGVAELDAFGAGSFDAVASTLVFSELSPDEVEYALDECWRILRPGGQLLIGDEILPDSTLGRLATFLLRLPFVILAFLLTQNTTRRVAGLERRIKKAGFRVLETRHYLAGTLRLFVAQRVE
jgi:demethylmenaquinone methyltransferase/2-methoxy-6-polyprenyl-1,4-benzoquinol methylase